MYFRREHPDYLRSETSPSVVEAAQTYFPSLDLGLLQQWWIYVDDGGSVNSADVALAVQFAVVHNFVKNLNLFRTEDQAKIYIEMGVQAEADAISALKGTSADVELESYKLAYSALFHALSYQDSLYAYPDSHSMHSSYSSSSSVGWGR